MKTIFQIALALHIIGISGIIGGWMAQLSAPVKTASRAMIDGAWTALAAALVMMGVASGADVELNNQKFGLKGAIFAAVITLLMQSRKKDSIEKGTYFVIGLLAITNVFIAVLWK